MRDVALVGLPTSGKSTVFTAVSGHVPQRGSSAPVAVVSVPDARVDKLAEIYRSKKTTYAQLEIVDVAGLDPHSLGAARAADALAVVLRAFGDDVDVARDLASFRAELAVADLSTMEKVRDRATKQAKAGSPLELEVAEKAEAALSDGHWLSEVDWTPEQRQTAALWTPLTLKPFMLVVNADHDFVDAPAGGPSVSLLGAVESEARELPAEDAAELLREYGITEPAHERFLRAAFETMDLITFLTGNAEEARSWDIPRGAKAPQAAGAIHTDLEKGFIRAERLSFDDLVSAGSYEAAREKGLVRVEGKDYVVNDGDYLAILHS
jgi:ribosome-binding ATPase YchF (GTP1/OBG family)